MKTIPDSKAILTQWDPENEAFWETKGKRIAWRTLTITTISLVLSFTTWFMMSAVVVRLPGIGFKFDTMQLFWLAAMPGLAGGSLRILHTFLIPIFGTRNVIMYTNALKLFPVIGIGFAVMNPATPWWLFMVLAFAAGFGGGDFSSYMPSTSLFFPKRLQGTALGIQAGIGNFGVSLVQFLTPWIIGFPLLAMFGASQVLSTPGGEKSIWLQNAAFIYVPLIVIMTFVAWRWLRRIPIKASVRDQMDIFSNKHTWFCTITYVMTFGSFSGFAAIFPLLIKTTYGGFEGAPDPLTYAFLGPLIGSAMRVIAGPFADRIGGGIITHVVGLGLIIVAIAVPAFGLLSPTSLDSFPMFVTGMLVLFFFSGVGNASTFRQFPVIFSHSARQGAGVIGWTASIAAYGPFVFSALTGLAISATGSPEIFFYGAAVFYFIATVINWWYYTRKGCEVPC
ncbi:MAG: nitrate/nitrite transporter [Bacteroidota bacterium]